MTTVGTGHTALKATPGAWCACTTSNGGFSAQMDLHANAEWRSSARSSGGQIGAGKWERSSASGVESPVAKTVTWCPLRLKVRASSAMISSVPPYPRGGTATAHVDNSAIRMGQPEAVRTDRAA